MVRKLLLKKMDYGLSKKKLSDKKEIEEIAKAAREGYPISLDVIKWNLIIGKNKFC